MLDIPMSFRDRSVVFELSRLPLTNTAHEVYMSLDKDDSEAVFVLVWGGEWAFPMAPNTHGLALPLDRTHDLFFRIQVEDQTTAPDLVTPGAKLR